MILWGSCRPRSRFVEPIRPTAAVGEMGCQFALPEWQTLVDPAKLESVKTIAGDCAAIIARGVRHDPGVRHSLLGGRSSTAQLLRPVVGELAESAVALLDQMLPMVTLDITPTPTPVPAAVAFV